MRTIAKCAIAPSYLAPRISASQRAEASLSWAGTIVWLSSKAIAHLRHLPDSCGAAAAVPQAWLDRHDFVGIELPIAFRRRGDGGAREPRAGGIALAFGRQDHAAEEARVHLPRAPGDDRVAAGLPPSVAGRDVAHA